MSIPWRATRVNRGTAPRTVHHPRVYRRPLAFFWTIPGTVLIGPPLGHLTYVEVIGAYVATGVLTWCSSCSSG